MIAEQYVDLRLLPALDRASGTADITWQGCPNPMLWQPWIFDSIDMNTTCNIVSLLLWSRSPNSERQENSLDCKMRKLYRLDSGYMPTSNQHYAHNFNNDLLKNSARVRRRRPGQRFLAVMRDVSDSSQRRPKPKWPLINEVFIPQSSGWHSTLRDVSSRERSLV
jgi:hypothetical protein